MKKKRILMRFPRGSMSQILLKMKLLTILLLSVFAVSAASNSYSQQTKFNLKLADVTVKKVFTEIEENSEFILLYNENEVDVNRKVDVKVKNESVQSVLNQVFHGTGNTYKIYDRQIVILESKNVEIPKPIENGKVKQDEKKTIKGKVVDEQNQPLPGASVIVKGTTIGVTTDINGEFSLAVPINTNLLQISFIGMKTQNIDISTESFVTIQMELDETGLDEVVVTALGMKKSEKMLGYAVQEVDGSVLQKAPEANVLSNLTGKVAGLTVYNTTEFYSTPSITLRGENPLIVIDGVPVSTDFWNISPNDVEEMSILKGATASALYGSRGAGGAIMITTKKGVSKDVRVEINSNTMFKAGYVAIPKPQSAYGTGDNGLYAYGDGAGGGINDAGTYIWGPRLDERDESTASGWKELPQWDSPIDPETGERIPTPWRSRGKDNLKNFLETGYITTNNINVTQRGEKGSFRVSMSHAYQKGQVPNTKLNNSTITLGGTMKLFDKLNLESSFSYNKQISPNLPTTGYGGSGYVYNLLVWSGVDFDIRDFRDYWLVEDVQQKYYQYTKWYNNPYFLAYENEHGYARDVAYGFVSLNYEFTKDLKLTGRTGINTSNVRQDTKTPISLASGLGNYSESTNNSFDVNADLILTYDKEINDNFGISALAGGTLNYNEYRSLSASTDGLNVPGFFALANSTNSVSASNYIWKKQVNSVFGKMSFAYKNGIFLDVTGRNDWSSSLPSETRSYFYPSVAFSGIISEFLEMPKEVSLLKVRASWTLSKKDIEPYSIQPAYVVSSDVWDGQSTASYPETIRGAEVKAEETRTYEMGTDLRFFNNRLKFDFSYYNTLRYNMISNASISDASGFSSKTVNTEEQYEKRGFEVVIGGQPIKTKDFSWNTNVNWSTYKWYWNKVDDQFSPNTEWVSEGARMDYWVGWDWSRDPAGNVVHGSSGYPVWDSQQSVLGYTGEDFVWGWNNDIIYKDFILSFSLDGRVGGMMHSETNQAMWNSGAHPESVNQDREAAANGIKSYIGEGVVVVSGEVIRDETGKIISDTRVFEPNTTNVSYITYMKRTNPYVGSQTPQNLFDETFVKLREVSLTYNIPKVLVGKLGLSAANIGIVGRNLWLWTKEVDHVDPDSGGDYLSSASYRNIGFNLKLTF